MHVGKDDIAEGIRIAKQVFAAFDKIYKASNDPDKVVPTIIKMVKQKKKSIQLVKQFDGKLPYGVIVNKLQKIDERDRDEAIRDLTDDNSGYGTYKLISEHTRGRTATFLVPNEEPSEPKPIPKFNDTPEELNFIQGG